jgi:hypothetical protein
LSNESQFFAPMPPPCLALSEGEVLNRVGNGASHLRRRLTQEFIMKKFVIAAVAVLSLGVGVASAHPVVVNRLGQVIWGPTYTAAPPGTGE